MNSKRHIPPKKKRSPAANMGGGRVFVKTSHTCDQSPPANGVLLPHLPPATGRKMFSLVLTLKHGEQACH